MNKFFNGDAGLMKDGPQGSLGDIAGMIGNGGSSSRHGIVPDFMASLGLAVKSESGFLEFMNKVPNRDGWQSAHRTTATGMDAFTLCDDVRANPLGRGSP